MTAFAIYVVTAAWFASMTTRLRHHPAWRAEIDAHPTAAAITELIVVVLWPAVIAWWLLRQEG